MLELLHKKSNALQAVFERNQVLAKYLAQDDMDEALKQLSYCNQLIEELSQIERQLSSAADSAAAKTPQGEKQIRMERSMQRAILNNLQGLMAENMQTLREKTEQAKGEIRNVREKRDGVKAYSEAFTAYSGGTRLDASR